jgi:hypothetical protein
MNKILQKYPFFYWALPLFFVLHGYLENAGLIPEKDALLLLVFYIIISLLVFLLCKLLLKRNDKGIILATTVMSIFFFFGSLHDFLKNIAGTTFISRYSILLPVLLISSITVFFILRKHKNDFKIIFTYLNLLFFLLLLFECINLVTLISLSKKSKRQLSNLLIPCENCNTPNVYIIVADEYTGQKSLKEQFGFDNSFFENQLTERGFHVIRNGTSNYNATSYSMSSMLNLDFISGLKSVTDSKENIETCYEVFKTNQTQLFLENSGYQFFNLSNFEFSDNPAPVHSVFLPGSTSPITSQTLFGRIYRDLWYHLVTDLKIKSAIRNFAYAQLDRNNKLFDQTISTIKEKKVKPKFVYTHLVMPHNPYFFNSEGKLAAPEILTPTYRSDKKAYIEYLQYTNKKLLEIIDLIQKNSNEPPVILLMGDHGFRHYNNSRSDSLYQFDILSAVLLPGKDNSGFYENMTTINIMRTILNRQFKQQLPLLKDSTVFIIQ